MAVQYGKVCQGSVELNKVLKPLTQKMRIDLPVGLIFIGLTNLSLQMAKKVMPEIECFMYGLFLLLPVLKKNKMDKH